MVGYYATEVDKRRGERENRNRELVEVGTRVRIVEPEYYLHGAGSGQGYGNSDVGIVWQVCADEKGKVTSVRVHWITDKHKPTKVKKSKDRVRRRIMTLFLWEFEIERVSFVTSILDRISAYKAQRDWGDKFA